MGYEFLTFLQIVHFNHVFNLKQYFFYKINGNLSLLKIALFISIDFMFNILGAISWVYKIVSKILCF